jgi:transketolase
MKKSLVSALLLLAENDPNVILITADLGFGAFEKFQEKFPSQYFNVGIAEQAMMGIASGMALLGKKVFVYSIGNFVTLRCLEQIRNDACYHNLNINIICQGGGFTYGAAGMSHHATEDIGVMRALPNVSVFTPLNGYETFNIVEKASSIEGVKYIRLENDSMCYQAEVNKEIFSPTILKDSGYILIASYGSIVSEIMRSVVGRDEVSVISFACLKPINFDIWAEICRRYRYIIVIEEHQVFGGLGTIFSEVIVKNRLGKPLDIMAINDHYTSIVGDQKYLRGINRINESAISKHIDMVISSLKAELTDGI